MKKKIGIDLRCLPKKGESGAGVAHAARALCERLILNTSVEWIAYVPDDAKWSGTQTIKLPRRSGAALRHALKSNPCDLLFVPAGAIPPLLSVPAIPWVHDLIIFDHPEWFPQSCPKRKITTKLFANGLKKAPIVFAVSEYTKNAIIKHIKISANDIIVTGEGGDGELLLKNKEQRTRSKEQSAAYCRSHFNIKRPFALCLGTVEPRKNMAMLIRAWKLARLESPSAPDLVIAGKDGWKMKEVQKEIETLNAADKQFFHRLRNLSDDDRRQLLLAAQVVAVPSHDEGFGLVALEAMQAGTPVIASNAGALPEVIGQAGSLLNPYDEQAWTSAILTCVDDERTCETRAELGLKQLKKWSWENSAKIIAQKLVSFFKES